MPDAKMKLCVSSRGEEFCQGGLSEKFHAGHRLAGFLECSVYPLALTGPSVPFRGFPGGDNYRG